MDKDTQREDSHVKTEAGMGAMCPQAKERQGPRQPPEAGQARQVSSLESEGTRFCPHPDFGPLASRAGRERPAVLSGVPCLCPVRAAPGNESRPHPRLLGLHRAHSPRPRGGTGRTDKPAVGSLWTAVQLASLHCASPKWCIWVRLQPPKPS